MTKLDRVMNFLTKAGIVFVAFYLSWQCERAINTWGGDLFYFVFWIFFYVVGGLGLIAFMLFEGR